MMTQSKCIKCKVISVIVVFMVFLAGHSVGHSRRSMSTSSDFMKRISATAAA